MKLEYRDYKNLTWGPVAAVLGTLSIYFAAQVLAGILLVAVLLLLGWDMDRISAWLGGGGSAQFVLIVVVGFITLGLLYMFLQSRGAKPKDIGLVRPKLGDIGYMLMGLGIYIVLYIVVTILTDAFTTIDTTQKQELGFSTATAGPTLGLVFVALVIVPPLVEEVISRGFLYSGLRKKFLFMPAAIITSVIFGLAHLGGGEGGSTIWIAFIDTFVLAMVLAYLRERTGSLWASIGLHALKNLIAFLGLFIFKVV